MAQYQITVDSQLLQQLFLGNSQDTGVAKLLESVLNQILQAQVTEQIGAEHYERTEERQGYRNGSYPHQLTTRVGTLTLRVPRIRGGKFSTELFARYQRSEQALVLALMEMVVNGVSTRKSCSNYRRTMRDELFQVDRLGSVQASGSDRDSMEQPPALR